MTFARSMLLGATLVGVSVTSPCAQTQRLAIPIDDRAIAPITGNIHPGIVRSHDAGALPATTVLPYVTLVFSRSTTQQQALDAFLANQQDPTSADYHRWLTPEQYADRYGLNQHDFSTIEQWLTGHGFAIVDRSRGRSTITINGTAGLIAQAFHTELHRYDKNGVSHFANATEPSVPAALAGVITGIRGLNDFRPQPRASVRVIHPKFTSSISGNHFTAPDDFATIYNLAPLYAQGIDGTGEKIAVVGQTNVTLSDIQTFRSVSGLSKNDPQLVLVPGARNPGIVADDLSEVDLDIEWAGAVARSATLIYVYSSNVLDSLQYAINQDIAPVISISYGGCEADFSAADVRTLTTLGEQANAQGQTIVAASGDDGATDCDYATNPNTPITSATHGLAVDLPAALPYVTGVGGTEFTPGAGTYWSSTNNTNNGSALSYIPETAWNDTATEIAAGGTFAAGGGGKSTLFSKPAWQAGVGIPDDGMRDVPDVSLNASFVTGGYLVCSTDTAIQIWVFTAFSLTP